MSLSNFFIPNDYDINCHNITIENLLTVNSIDVANIITDNIITTNLGATGATINNLILPDITENELLTEILARDPSDNTVHWLNVVGVTGPVSSTDTAIATFNGTTGQIIQNTTVTLSAGIIASPTITFPTTGGTAANLNYYEEFSTVAALTGIWASNPACTLKISRIGNMVTYMIASNVLVNATISSTIALVLAGGIPARLRPVTDFHSACVVQDNSLTIANGTLLITAAGSMTIASTNGAVFSGLATIGTSGVFGFAVSYLIS